MPIYNLSTLTYAFIYLYKKNKFKELKPKVKIILNKVLWISLIYMLPLIFLFINSTRGLTSILSFSYKNRTPGFNIIYFITLIPSISILFYPNLVFGANPSSTNMKNKLVNNYKNIFKNFNEKVEEKTETTEDLNRILNYMDTKKPYLNTDFSVHELSRMLNIPQIRISNCFNKQINIPFPKYRNDLRIKHAVHMFRGQKHVQMSIEGIAMQSGFKTKSAFYAAFKAEYKMTPTEWIEKNKLIMIN
jgi:AraC-like DNA-binding protein